MQHSSSRTAGMTGTSSLKEAELMSVTACSSVIPLFNVEEHVLVQAINNLSMKVQKELAATKSMGTKGNYVILKLENDSVEYIEKINLNVLESILIENRAAVKSPESECSFVMTSINNMRDAKSLYPLTDLESVVLRIKEVINF